MNDIHCRPESSLLIDELVELAPNAAAERLETLSDEAVAEVMARLSPAISDDIMLALGDDRRAAVIKAAPQAYGRQWAINLACPEDSIGRLMEPPHAVFLPGQTVAETIEKIRKLSRDLLVTYGYITDRDGRLQGVVAMRDLLLADRSERLESIMLRHPFSLRLETPLIDAMKEVVNLHVPVYPVCDGTGKLVGTVRGRTLFEQHAIEISAQAGSLVGVEKEERLSTPWPTSLRFRHPWLQINLLTAFVAAAVVGAFQGTINRWVILAVFLPVLAGQSGNTGCQSLAVTLRGLTLGELKRGRERALVFKEALLGLLNGALVGLSAAVGMFVLATIQGNDRALVLAVVVFLAMIGACVISGIAGALIPLAMRRIGADPATASSIFLTTATDVASMGLFLALATWLV